MAKIDMRKEAVAMITSRKMEGMMLFLMVCHSIASPFCLVYTIAGLRINVSSVSKTHGVLCTL